MILLAATLLAQSLEPPLAPNHSNPDNFGAYILGTDYPAGAASMDQQGLVGFTVAFGTNGRVSDCVVTRSSGYHQLDAGTCRLARLRLRLDAEHPDTPATVLRSRAFRISWLLAGAPPPPHPAH